MLIEGVDDDEIRTYYFSGGGVVSLSGQLSIR